MRIQQKIAAQMPMMNAAHGRTNPAHGVMVARPAMAPTQTPTRLGRFMRHQSMNIQTVRAALAATSELVAAKAAPPVEARAEPPSVSQAVKG